MILGLSHIAIYASDLDRAARLFGDVLGGRPIAFTHGSDQRAFELGGVRLILMHGAAPTKSDEHIAFRVSAASLPALETRIGELGLRSQFSRPRGDAPPSLYLEDWDGHLIELHAEAP